MPSNESRNKTPTRPQGACGRADLAAALADGNVALARAVAEFAGFDWQPKPPDSHKKKLEDDSEADQRAHDQTEGHRVEVVVRPLARTPFWRPVEYEPIAENEPAPPSRTAPYQGWRLRPPDPPPIPPLAGWRELEPKLRRCLCLPQQSRAIDLALTVHRISEGRFLADLPRERHRRWGPVLQIIEDRSRRLIPYRLDQYLVREALQRLLPAHALSRGVFRDGMRAPRLGEDGTRSQAPPPGSLVLVLGDLGCLAIDRAELCEHWWRYGRDLRAAGSTPVALIPGPLERCPGRLAQVWELIPWERPRPCDPEDTLELRAERLLRLISPAVRIEPGLLRAARLLLQPSQVDAGTEADVWQHPDLISRSAAGATLSPERAKPLRAEFASQIDSELQKRFAVLLRTWRGYLPEEIWFEEVLNLPPAAQTAAEVAQDLPCARDYFSDFVRGCGDKGIAATGGDLEWFSRVERRAERLWGDEQVGADLQRLSYALHEQDPDYQPHASFYPALIPRLDKPVSRLAVRQRGEGLEFVVAETRVGGSPLAELTSRNLWLRVETPLEEPDRNPFWKSGKPPTWADNWGTDEYGPWVTFSIPDKEGHKITQRMRWIKPGTFMMGSPENEPERYDDESPQHQVTISQGFWLFDTACTQALWQAVMGSNPSRFNGADRPVENVSWNDCQDFLKKLNNLLLGLDLSLPTEAQWEYACRAGTTTPFSFGANITPEQVNYDGNYPYPGGKKGLYRQQTVPVASLPANPWGLYEMHGNVYEWTQDHWHDNYQGAPADGSAWVSTAGAQRVFRGGSWRNGARSVRAAYRLWLVPGLRLDILGFRCARVQVSQAGQAGAELAEPALGRKAELRPAPVQSSGAVRVEPTLLRLDASQPQVQCSLPQAPAFLIHTDRERLTFGQITKPDWASAIGRDRFGLWSEIAIDPGQGEPVIQRLRWIPPGRFWMGSPEEETRGLAKDKTEREWFEQEHPRHQVILTQGYWLFDTPCTQALWEAVMGGKNPSRFKSSTRPVEQVSWKEVQKFMDQINKRVQNLNLVLPSEAQWEYACRAGTETAIYTGDLEILGERNAPALDPIAWYGGNSGVDFDLPEGENSSDWLEKQYPHTRTGTRPVKLKQPNPWGLYDMLGNVWEWTQDHWHDDYHGAPADGSAWEDKGAGAGRVVRGGSWRNDARLVRAAFRPWIDPDNRLDLLGFRCARVQG